MHSLLIGGGKIGYYLTKVLIEKGYDESVVEKEKEACQKFANDLNITVIKGDGTSVSVLEQAGVADADSVIAVTGRDEDNLVAIDAKVDIDDSGVAFQPDLMEL